MTLTQICRAVREEIVQGPGPAGSAEEISQGSGLCADFATLVYEQARDEGITARVVSDEDFDMPGIHSWIYDGKKHYDAEACEGVFSPSDLPIYSDQS